MFTAQERGYLETRRVGRLATADSAGRPHVVPICYALAGDQIVTPIDEKPQRVDPSKLRRSRDIDENPRVALVVDHYTETWSQLGWLQIRGTATRVAPGETHHTPGVSVLEAKYDQYATHDLSERPLISIDPGSVRSWGRLEHPSESVP